MRHAKSLRGLAHELRGSIYHDLHATQKALAEYERAIALDPFLVSALLRRAVARSATETLRRSPERLQHGHQHR